MNAVLRASGLTPVPLNTLVGCTPTSAIQIRRIDKSKEGVTTWKEVGHFWEARIYDTTTDLDILRSTGASAQDAVDMLELLAIELLR